MVLPVPAGLEAPVEYGATEVVVPEAPTAPLEAVAAPVAMDETGTTPTSVVVPLTEVVRPTWGTVMETGETTVVEEPAMVEPSPLVQGTTSVAVTMMVVAEA